MSDGTLFWFVVGGISTVIFFGIAAVATWRGIVELRELLGGKENRGDQEG